MSRTPISLFSLALTAFLVSCAQNGGAAADTPRESAASPPPPVGPVVAPVLAPSSAKPAAQSVSSPEAAEEAPIVIRGTDRVIAPQRVPANSAAKGVISRLQFENAPVSEVVNVMLRDLLKVDYVVHPPLNGTVTLTTRQAIDADRALQLLETALQANGVVMARDSRGTYHVGTPEALRGIVSAPVLAAPGQRMPPGYGTVILPLQYLGAGEMANILRPMVSADAILRVDTVRNILVMRGTRAEAEGWLELVNTFDVNLLRGMSVGVFPLKHTSAADVEAALRMLSGGAVSGAAAGTQAAGAAGRAQGSTPSAQARGGGGPAAAQSGQPGATGGLTEGSPLFGALRVMPIERINAILVVTPRAAYLDEVRYWIEQFDRPNLNSGEPQLFVYKVQNGSATHLAELLNGIYGGSTSTSGGGATGVAPGLNSISGTSGNVNSSFASQYGSARNQTGFGAGSGFGTTGGNLGSTLGGGAVGVAQNQQNQQNQQGPGVVTATLGQSVRVMADRINNTLLVHAPPAEYARIEGTLKRLDIQRAQILIEASIVEVSLTDGLEYGLEWSFKNGFGDGRNGTGVIGAAAAIASGGGLASTGVTRGGFSYTLSNGAGNITAVLKALAERSLVKVISSPSLMVLDNHTAAIQVGNQQPVSTGTTYTGIGANIPTTNIQYKDTGVMLGVTPSVNSGDLVQLDINQIVTDLGADSASEQTKGYPTFMQRQINSKVAVRSGETLVLGGLIQDNGKTSKSGVPLLSSIPIIGAAFSSNTNSTARTELLVVITPRVIRSDEDARAVSRELRERMRGLTTHGLPSPALPSRSLNQGAMSK